MGDADREFKVRITGDASSLVASSREASDGLERVSGATRKGTEANLEHGKSFVHAESSGRLFHRLLHQITEDSPLLGVALRVALSPIGGAIMGATMLFKEFSKAIEESNKRADEMAAAFGRPMGDVKKAISETVDEIHKADVAHADWAANLIQRTGEIQTQLDLDIAKLKAEADAVKSTTAAKKEALLEELRLEKELGKITEEQYASRKAGIQGGAFAAGQAATGTAGRAEIDLVAKALLDTTEQLRKVADQEAAAFGATQDPTRLRQIKVLPGEKDEAERLVGDYKKWSAEQQDKIDSLMKWRDFYRGIAGGKESLLSEQFTMRIGPAQEELDRLQQGFITARKSAETFQDAQSRLTQQQTDSEEAHKNLHSQVETLTKQFESLSIKLDSLQTKFGIEGGAAGAQAGLKGRALNAGVLADLAGKDLGSVVMPGASAYDAFQHGQKLTTLQAGSLQALTQLLSGHYENWRAVLDLLRADRNNSRAMAEDIRALRQDLDNSRHNNPTRNLPGSG